MSRSRLGSLGAAIDNGELPAELAGSYLDPDANALRAQGAATEREACAQLAEQHKVTYGCYVDIDGKQTSGLRSFAALIRARGADSEYSVKLESE